VGSLARRTPARMKFKWVKCKVGGIPSLKLEVREVVLSYFSSLTGYSLRVQRVKRSL
jgi:hypothetical protein